jgi:hypothetical protein
MEVPAGLSEQARCRARAPRSSKVVSYGVLGCWCGRLKFLEVAGIQAQGRCLAGCAAMDEGEAPKAAQWAAFSPPVLQDLHQTKACRTAR